VAQTATPAAASSVPASGDFAGLVDIGDGRKMYLECRGTGSPTVILVDGYRGRGDSWSTDFLQPDAGRTMVRPGVAAFTRVCSYDRPGTVLDENTFSRSDPVPQPQTAADAVADLHALLRAAVIPGPYVLVGHSYGGLVVRLYASTYPAEVAGLVLVDALPAVEKFLTPAQWAAYQHLFGQQPDVLAAYRDLETVDLAASAAQVREAAAAAPLRPLPLVVLTRVRPFDLPLDLPPGFSAEALERAWAAGQAELAALAPGARHVVATESGHGIQQDQPDLVVAAIRQVVDAVRDPRTWPTPAAGTPTP
jgi:pimeloyl-ACP methyl ester carboxylesterase